MPNLKKHAALLMMLALLLQGCGSKLADLQLGSLPAMPELPASARQEKQPPLCSPTCLVKWKELAEGWQRRLTEPGLPAGPVSGSMMEYELRRADRRP